MKIYLSALFAVLTLLILSASAIAVIWSPQDNISLKNRYYITNDPAGNCASGYVIQGKLSDGTWNCTLASAGSGDITGINTDGSFLDGACATGTCNLTVNQTNLNTSIDDRDADTWAANQTSYFNISDIIDFNYWNDTYATFNKTYADTLYSLITEPLWTANQSSYFTKTEITNLDYWNDTYATFNKTYADTLFSTIDEPLWSANQSSYFTKSEIVAFDFWNDTYATFNKTYADTLYYLKTEIDTQGEMETIWGASLATDTELAAQDACSEITNCVPNAFDAYSDFMGTMTSNKLCRWDGSEIDCDYTDATGGGGTSIWETSGIWAILNTTATSGIDDILVDWIEASNWTNVSITESQISDLGTYALSTEPLWTANQSDYFTKTEITNFEYWNDTYATFNKTYADTLYVYTAGDALTLTGNDFDFDGGASPGGELGGSWASPTVDSGIHDDEYIELGDSFAGDISGTYDSISIDCSDVIGDGLDCDVEKLVIAPGDFAGSGLNAFDSNLELGGMAKNWDGGSYNITAEGFMADDNEGSWYGSSQDSNIYFNGTCLIIQGPTTQGALC